MADVFIVAAKRSAIGSFGGSLKDTPPIELAIPVAKAAIEQSGISAQNIDHAILGPRMGFLARSSKLFHEKGAASSDQLWYRTCTWLFPWYPVSSLCSISTSSSIRPCVFCVNPVHDTRESKSAALCSKDASEFALWLSLIR